MYGRQEEEDDRRNYSIHHHRIGRMPRYFGAAIMWLAATLWDF